MIDHHELHMLMQTLRDRELARRQARRINGFLGLGLAVSLSLILWAGIIAGSFQIARLIPW